MLSNRTYQASQQMQQAAADKWLQGRGRWWEGMGLTGYRGFLFYLIYPSDGDYHEPGVYPMTCVGLVGYVVSRNSVMVAALLLSYLDYDNSRLMKVRAYVMREIINL